MSDPQWSVRKYHLVINYSERSVHPSVILCKQSEHKCNYLYCLFTCYLQLLFVVIPGHATLHYNGPVAAGQKSKLNNRDMVYPESPLVVDTEQRLCFLRVPGTACLCFDSWMIL